MKKEKSCGAIILRENNNKLETLLLKHNAGHWAFAKGHIEGNETEEETARREIKEETKLDVKIDTKFRTSVVYSPMEDVEKEVVYFLAYKTAGEEEPQLEEISQIMWTGLDEAIEKVTFDNDKEIIKKVKKYIEKGEMKMKRKRGFEIAKGFEDKNINLPVRKTKYSAGYDIEAAEDCVIPPFKRGDKPFLVKTGLKAYMQGDEYLKLCNRSSNPGKKGLILANSIGVVDSDYYGNEDNDGHIMFAFYNIKNEDTIIKKGDCIGQAIFEKFLVTDDDTAEGERKGGFGSTNK